MAVIKTTLKPFRWKLHCSVITGDFYCSDKKDFTGGTMDNPIDETAHKGGEEIIDVTEQVENFIHNTLPILLTTDLKRMDGSIVGYGEVIVYKVGDVIRLDLKPHK
ncbi:hypothetical protein AC477_00050 [miscellaneous Crenarchaeota group-1 archaeon SG8-32-1]|uniref:Uncharacterized protein n=1 Tax=miscellaneous Crenarchaeota group-1 archaeon SG8-32-1 TaxID=1685124 RepID=A0A0M0C1H3_9ARCH|nr:MAG: hypothetical protein AC477_00050 [miscellaneous Crenarchaeota group-1 archaeon SG8-32-1]